MGLAMAGVRRTEWEVRVLFAWVSDPVLREQGWRKWDTVFRGVLCVLSKSKQGTLIPTLADWMFSVHG